MWPVLAPSFSEPKSLNSEWEYLRLTSLISGGVAASSYSWLRSSNLGEAGQENRHRPRDLQQVISFMLRLLCCTEATGGYGGA